MIGMVTKQMFFRPKAVTDATDGATKKAMSRFGAFVRTGARSSIRKRKKVSAPGKPPSSHTGALKRGIVFGYDRANESVVTGVKPLNMVTWAHAPGGRGWSPQKGQIPETLEYGGSLRVLEVFKWGKWRRADLRSRRRLAGLKTRSRKYTIAARPFMGPSFDEEKPKFPEMLAAAMTAMK